MGHAAGGLLLLVLQELLRNSFRTWKEWTAAAAAFRQQQQQRLLRVAFEALVAVTARQQMLQKLHFAAAAISNRTLLQCAWTEWRQRCLRYASFRQRCHALLQQVSRCCQLCWCCCLTFAAVHTCLRVLQPPSRCCWCCRCSARHLCSAGHSLLFASSRQQQPRRSSSRQLRLLHCD